MAERITFELNGETQSVAVAPDTPLLYVLRNELGLSNPHFGCGLAQCGACTVHVDGAPTRSCSVPLSAVAGTKVTTLAGLGTLDKPHPQKCVRIGGKCLKEHSSWCRKCDFSAEFCRPEEIWRAISVI